jgi:fructokinase
LSYIAVIGEAVADTFVSPEQSGQGTLDLRVRPGGGPANTAVALARLGVPTRFVGRIPRNLLGNLLRDHLTGSGVDLSLVAEATEETTLALATIDGDGHAQYAFYANGTADWQWSAAELAAHTPLEAGCVHAGSLALVLEPGGGHIERLLGELRGKATISIDPNVRPGMVPIEVYRSRLRGWTSIADVFRLSEDDLGLLRPGASIEEVCDEWHADGVRLVVVTQGERGSVGSYDGQRIFVPAQPVDTVDTVGAGDAFTAGLLFSLRADGLLGGALDDLDFEALTRALEFASGVAAETCRVPGADPPWGEYRLPRNGFSETGHLG